MKTIASLALEFVFASVGVALPGCTTGPYVGPQDEEVNTFGLPQKDAKVLCHTAELRLSAWNDAAYLYVQAVLWKDGDDTPGLTDDGRKIGDNSTLNLDVDGNGKATEKIDRNYSLDPWPSLPGLNYSVVLGEGMTSGLQKDSKGRGSIQYVEIYGGRKVRVDSYLIPLAEIGRKPGDVVKFAYWGSSTTPELVVNSVGYTSEKKKYWPHTLPRKDWHDFTLVDRAATLDEQKVPEGRGTIAVKARSAMPKVGEEAPEVSAAKWFNWEGKEPPTLKGLHGKVVVVEFWATWCGPCVAGIPHLNEMYEKHAAAKDDLVILSFTDQDPTPIEKFVKDKPMKYTVGAGSETVEKYGVSGIPHAFVIGRDGKLLWQGHPAEGKFDEQVEAALKAK